MTYLYQKKWFVAYALCVVGLLFFPAMSRALVCESIYKDDRVTCFVYPSDITAEAAKIECDTVCRRLGNECKSKVLDACRVDPNVFVVKATTLQNPMRGDFAIDELIGTLIKRVIGVIGAVTFLIFAYGGFRWLTSAGNEDNIKAGTDAMKWAVIGLIIIFSSYAILTTFLVEVIG